MVLLPCPFLMTAKKTVKWIEEENTHQRLIFPEMDLNANARDSGRPVGNSPELVPLDCSINEYVRRGEK